MKEHPILFSGPLVRAILDGRKTQTRRLLRVQPELPMLWYPTPYSKRSLAYDGEAHFRRGVVADFAPWKVGDRLWVREAWGLHDTQPSDGPDRAIVYYRASEGGKPGNRYQLWRPSIHMPRWASRIDLEVTEVRVQRIQEISDADILAEGILEEPLNDPRSGAYRGQFQVAWEQIYRGTWAENAWVWAVSFKRVQA